MNVYILDRVDELTWSYHEEGGMVVVAGDLEDAKTFVAASSTPKYGDDEDDDGERRPRVSDEEWANAKVLPLAGEHERAIHIHEDSGCC
jgi:hypothetical protein